MGLKYRFDEVLEFPCHQDLRIIVLQETGVQERLVRDTGEITGQKISVKEAIMDSRPSRSGKYVSYTVRVRFASAQLMEKLYEELPKLDYVMHLL